MGVLHMCCRAVAECAYVLEKDLVNLRRRSYCKTGTAVRKTSPLQTSQSC